MKKVLMTVAITLIASVSFACDDYTKEETVCVTCPAGAKGEKGDPGVGVPGPQGEPGIPGRDGATVYREDSNADAGIAGAMAMARIGHARLGGEVVGIGLANFDGENAIALGLEKSWKTNTRSFNEVSIGVAGFVASDTSGVAGSVNLHF